MLLLVALFSLTGARAQQTLPYSYGFEDNDLSVDGWTTSYQGSANASDFGINSAAAQNGSYGFRFSSYNRDDVTYDQYLISPELSSTGSFTVQFSYKASSSYGTEQFKVGYSTTDANPSSFTFGDEISTNNTSWTLSDEFTFPAGTKYVAIWYYSDYQYRLYVDDFIFEPAGAVAKPTGLEVIYEGGTEAKVRWISEEEVFDIEVNGEVTENVGNGYDLTGLELATTYTIRVRAKNGTEVSNWSSPVSFTTDACLNPVVVKYTLSDSYGDGWNGNYIYVYDEDDNLVATLTIESGDSKAGSLKLCGSLFTFYWKAGSYANETSWTFTDADGNELFSGTGSSDMATGDVLYELDLSDWRRPTDFAASQVSPTSAVLSWTENSPTPATSWIIAYIADGDEDVSHAMAESNPFTLEGLTPETSYQAMVSPYNDEGVLRWSNVITFTTDAAFPAPKELAASQVTVSSANISWKGADDTESYNLRYGEAAVPATATIILKTDNIWTDGSGYQMLLDADATAYGNEIPTSGPYTGTDYNAFEYTIPTDAECDMNTNTVVVGSSVTLEIPAGTYDWCITNPTAGDKIWIASENGSVGGRYDDYVFEAGKTYEFHVYLGGQNDATDVTITPTIDENLITWTTINDVTSPYTLEGLTAETGYVVQVQAIYADGESKWVSTFFTTPSDTDAPTDLAATDVMATSATLDWAGSQESYNVQYRKAAVDNVLLSEDFEGLSDGALPEGWTSIDNDGDGYNWASHTNTGTGNHTTHGGDGCMTSASYDNDSGVALTPDNWLITPQIALGGIMSAWFVGQDADWAAEHFAIYVSTTGNNVSDFTEIVPESVATGEYVEYTADLTSYAGQQGYIAFRHFNITDMFYLNLDDVTIKEVAPAGEWITVTATEAPLALTGLTPETEYEWQVQGILAGGTTEWSELSSFTTTEQLYIVELADDADNTEVIENDIAGETVNVQLTGRTLYKDGSWNTICLPFDVTVANSPLAGATVYELDTENSSLTTTTLTLNFNEVTTIEAGKPYLIKWTSGDNITDPIFYGVTIPEEGWEAQDVTACDGAITFTGTYDPVPFEAGNESILYVGANNKLYFPSAAVTMNAFRAYFQVDETSISKRIALKFGSDDATGISTVEAGDGSETIYNVAGMRMSKALKGVNIVNGKKILK